MNRRTFVRTMAVAGSASLAGCETFLYGKKGNEAAATAESELSKAATILNNVELTSDGKPAISSDDFEGYSSENVTQHTEIANEALADDDSDAAALLSDVSTIIEETAYQYESLDGVFDTVIDYERHYSASELEAAMRTGHRFTNRVAEVTEHANTISQHLTPMYEAGYEEPVEGFSLEKWGHEQGAFLAMAEPLGPLGVGFVHQAKGRHVIGRVSAAKQSGDYKKGIEEAEVAKRSLLTAEERFSASLELDLSYWVTFVEQLICQSNGFLNVMETVTKALEAYNKGNESEGDDMWEQAISEIEQVNQSCLSGN